MQSHYDRRESLNVRRFIPNTGHYSSTTPHDVAYNKEQVDLLIRAMANTVTADQCCLSYTKTTMIFGYNTITNPYHDRQSYFK